MKGLKFVGFQNCCECGSREMVNEYVTAMGRTMCYCEGCTEQIEEQEAIVDTIKNDIICNNMEYQDWPDFITFLQNISSDQDTKECYDYCFVEHRDEYEMAFDELMEEKSKRENNSLQVEKV